MNKDDQDTLPASIRQFALLAILVMAATGLADPPEGVTAWPDPPQGFQLGMLGPRTEAVDMEAYSRVFHVSADSGSDSEGKGTREAPWATLEHALAASGQSDKAHRVAILVAEGTYDGGPHALKSWVDLFGGFSNHTWERDVTRHPSVLEGRGEDRVLVGADHATVDGFVITGGRTRGPGGALFCHGTSPTITNNVFRRNSTQLPEDFNPNSVHHKWPAIPESGYDPAEMDAKFGHTTRRLRLPGNPGGAIALENFANPSIRNNLFAGNTTELGNGGAISMELDCIPSIGFNVFWGNTAGLKDDTNTRSGNGGAISIERNSRPGIMHNLFVANETRGRGDGGALYCAFFGNPEIRWNVFLNNFADDDGAVLESERFARPRLYANLMYGNRVRTGVISADESLYILENNIIAQNSGESYMGALASFHGTFRATNNTIVDNVSTIADAPAVYHVNRKTPEVATPVFQNNIVWGNRPIQVRFESDADTNYNLIEGGYPGYGNLNKDPKFVNDGESLATGSSKLDESTFTTTVVVERRAASAGTLRHRIARIGADWSLVLSDDQGEVTLWGLLKPAPASTLEVLPTYHLSHESSAIAKGQRVSYPPQDIDGDLRLDPCVDIGADQHVAR